jgi:hypothetical protein
MDSGFAVGEKRRLLELILEAMKEGWAPGSDAVSDGAWTDKQAEAKFAAAFKKLAERNPNNIASAVADDRTTQHSRGDVFSSMRK